MVRGAITGGMVRSMITRGRFAGTTTVALVAMAVTAALASVVSITGLSSPTPMTETTAMIRALTAPTFLAAGVLRLGQWRVTGEQACGLRAVAMLLMGGICLPSATVARELSGSGESLATVTCVRALSLGVILYVMAVAVSGDAAGRPHLGRKVAGLTVTTAVLIMMLLSGHDRLSPESTLQLVLSRGLAVALAFAWLAVAIGAVRKGRHEEWARPAAPLLAAMGVAELLQVPDRPAATLVAAALTAAVGVLVASSALVDLVRAAQDEHRASLDLSSELVSARGEVTDRDAWRAELTHNARSTLAGIRAAMQTLDLHADELEPADADRLRTATVAELAHLEHMLVRRSIRPGDFDVAEVIRTISDVRRAVGQRIDVRVQPSHVRAAPGDVATIVQNLLVNAHVHAPGARVSVDAHATGAFVHITVTDDGPGIPARSADAVFDRGFRGPLSPGTGLGLAVARALARQHGGELSLSPSAIGATFVLSLPLTGVTEMSNRAMDLTTQAVS
jgi:signal transduction histidine kinase